MVHGSLSASIRWYVIVTRPLFVPAGVSMVATGGVKSRLTTLNTVVVAPVPRAASDGTMRTRVGVNAVRPTPFAKEFQTNVWAVPPGEDARPTTPSPPGPGAAGRKVAPLSREYVTAMLQTLLSASVS